MRQKDTILYEGRVEDYKFIIAQNKSTHIIKYAPSTMNNFEKKAIRVHQSTLNDVISWFKDSFNIDLSEKLAKFKEAPNFDFKPANNQSNESIQTSKETKWNIGGKLKSSYLKVISLLKN